MICPACKTQMIILELDDVEIDYCHSCAGVWLDEGELDLLLDEKNENTSPVVKALKDGDMLESEKRRCPVCSKKMREVVLPLDPPVEIDKCPERHGLWFDKGELEEVVKAGRGETVSEFLNAVFKDSRK